MTGYPSRANPYNGSDGISADNQSSGTDLTITTTGKIEGGDDGISVDQRGTGNLTLTVVDVKGLQEEGINADTHSGSDKFTLTSTGLVTGATYGILATHDGSGALTIDVNDVTATNYDGINA